MRYAQVRKAALASEGDEAGRDLEEALLRRVLGVGRDLQEPEGHVVEPALVAAQQRLQRGGLAGER
jgi:hypothetical protein